MQRERAAHATDPRALPHGGAHRRSAWGVQKADIKPLAESIFPLVDQRADAELPGSSAYWEAEGLRAKLIAASPQYAAMLSGWQDVEPTPDDF